MLTCLKYRLFNLFHIVKSLIDVILQTIIGIFYSFLPKRIRYKSIENDTVLVTGGASGIGQKLALELAKRGAFVIICDLNEENLNNTRNLHSQYRHLQFRYYKCDVSKFDQLVELRYKILRHTSRTVSMLINNVGVVNGKHFLDLHESEIIDIMRINVLSNFWTVKTFLPDMIDARRGHIVNIGAITGLFGVSGLVDYCTSKFAVVGFEESLRNELKAEKASYIKSTIVCPWFIRTGLFNGVKSEIISFLNINHVVNEIISGILVNQEVIYIPKSMYFFYPLKVTLPVRAVDALGRLFKTDQMMRTFRGRRR